MTENRHFVYFFSTHHIFVAHLNLSAKRNGCLLIKFAFSESNVVDSNPLKISDADRVNTIMAIPTVKKMKK